MIFQFKKNLGAAGESRSFFSDKVGRFVHDVKMTYHKLTVHNPYCKYNQKYIYHQLVGYLQSWNNWLGTNQKIVVLHDKGETLPKYITFPGIIHRYIEMFLMQKHCKTNIDRWGERGREGRSRI